MIRRPPTLLGIADHDVEDLRKVLAQHKQDIETKKLDMFKVKGALADPNVTAVDMHLLVKYKIVQGGTEPVKSIS